jgi:DNA-directed RNA polymerase, mitochondrial
MIASKNQPVKWTSPVGLPVVQPYKKYKNYMVSYSAVFLVFKFVLLPGFLQHDDASC